jgi:Ca2+-binding RTX toxin-like protein
MWGEGGNDVIAGGGGRDVLYGGDGDDIIDGGGDADCMISGGPGDDTAKITRNDHVGMEANGTPDVEHIR